ncbi:sugar ABC transporter permease [Actinocatenispora rupis]|uniref:Sugar ABC transporter permease n=1 Tax=Actinocatenispora rupis TaxID=519421 RepID=A0A8J3N8G3_9ACTN|nr:sugar ABC transporter permease [Actinocatenispora rupis]
MTTDVRPERVGAPAPAAPRRRFRKVSQRNTVAGLVFLLPTLLIFLYFSWGPIVRSLVMSLQHTNLIGPARWVGLTNFTDLFDDPMLFTAVRNSVWFALLALVIGFPVPLLLAVAMSTLRRLGGLFRVLVYLPVVLPPVVSVLLWKWFYDPDSGLFNQALHVVGLGPYPWLQSGTWAMPSLVLEATWAGAGGTVLIYLAALTSVPAELYEAAELDGASIRRRVWHIALPQLRGIILIMLLLQVIGTLQVFTEPYVMTDGGPNDSTVTVLLLIYRYAFIDGNFGMATALSVLLAVVLAGLSVVYLRATRRWSS